MFRTKERRIELSASPILRPARRRCCLRVGVCVFIAICIVGQLASTFHYSTELSRQWEFSEGAANSTLGFASIYAVSRNGSPRKNSLLQAASLTNLHITIPVQPNWTEQDIIRIQAPENSTVDRGSALAWLGHLNALETFVNSSQATALIMEDDVDWDTRLRTQQVPQTAAAIRQLLGPRNQGGYYGNPKSWDIIWLGHCGDYFSASRGSDISAIKSYKDPAMPRHEDLHPWTRDFLRQIGASQNHQRLVHESVSPLCTFAYAITRHAAVRLLNELAASEPVRDLEHTCKAYDVRLLEGCRDEGLRCISVNPELFHHSGMSSEIAQITDGTYVEKSELTEESLVESSTTNIRCSARSKKWKEIQDSVTDPTIDSEAFVRDLAELSFDCHIDDL